MKKEFLRFLIAGGIAAAANYSSRFAFSLIAPFPLAISLAYGLGMGVAFFLMRRFVFDAEGQAAGPQFVKFALVNLVAFPQTFVVSLVLARWVLPGLGVEWHVEAIAHFIGIMVPAFSSYIGHRHATFRKP